ncbi:MAG: EamA family transporter [Nanoarchaeota archaeon]
MIDWFSAALVLVGTVIGALGALILKKGTINRSFKELFVTPNLWAGLFLYGLSTLFYLLALRREEISVLYPLVSTSYIWITIFSVRFLGEKMNKWKYLALVGIITGVVLIGIGS